MGDYFLGLFLMFAMAGCFLLGRAHREDEEEKEKKNKKTENEDE